jgi:hypothetical protein
MLEPYDGKLSRTVLRGAWGRKTLGPTRSLQIGNIMIIKSILSWKPNVFIVLFLAGALLGDELASNNPVVHISAMIVKLPSSNIGLLGDNVRRLPGIMKPTASPPTFAAPPEISSSEMKVIKGVLESPETGANILFNLSLSTENGKEAAITIGREPIYWISPTKDKQYEIHGTIGPGVNLKATPAIHGSRIQISIEVSHSELIERQAIPEAPGFQAGCPLMSIFTVSENTVLSDGATYVVAGSSTEDSTVLCFVTVQLNYTANIGMQIDAAPRRD